ncbi:MAG: response regulator [Lentisphaeraceae bacterium]|nr:response regulator [Lentisphaeraceae bacterium]
MAHTIINNSILVVEDNPHSLQRLKHALGNDDHSPFFFDNSRSALHAMGEIAYQLIIIGLSHVKETQQILNCPQPANSNTSVIILKRDELTANRYMATYYKKDSTDPALAEIKEQIHNSFNITGTLHWAEDQSINHMSQVSSAITTRESKILLVEDNKSCQSLTIKMLRELNYSVDLAKNGPQALLKCEQTAYDLIFMDINMPVMDGITATKELRNRGNNSLIIALATNISDKGSCYSASMDGFIAKPHTKQDILSELQYWGIKANSTKKVLAV